MSASECKQVWAVHLGEDIEALDEDMIIIWVRANDVVSAAHRAAAVMLSDPDTYSDYPEIIRVEFAGSLNDANL